MSKNSATQSPATNEGGATTISTVPSDVLLTNILTRLDGPTLASVSCSSTQLQSLSTNESLWNNICHTTWPSTNNPHMNNLISTFPNGPQSFFSDAFPLLDSLPDHHHHPPPQIPADELISAVDIHYRKKLIFSKVQTTETLSGWFMCSPFRIDLLDPKDAVPAPLHRSEDTCRDFADNLTLSWVIIDAAGRRAANLSTWKPVSVQQHWLSGEIQVKFTTVLGGGVRGGSTEFVKCGIVVTCGGYEGGDLHVREVYLNMEDMDGRALNGKEGLVILKRALESGKRRKEENNEGKKRYEEFMNMKKERKERQERREARLDIMCIALVISISTAFWVFVFYR